MRTRRLPTGGLAALAVLLAAIAVVVVAGVPPPRTIVETAHATTPTSSTTSPTRAPHHTTKRQHVTTVGVGTSPAGTSRPSAPVARPAAATRRAGPDASTTTTAPRRPVTSTTVRQPVSAAGAPVTRSGTFRVGDTSFTTRVGAVRAVSVSVRAGLKVTLSVACGLTGGSTTSVTTATVRLHGGGDACVATFAISPGSPQPAPWRLVTW